MVKHPSASTPKRDQPGDRTALLIIDMVNCFDFPGADAVKPKAERAARVIRRLRDRIEARGWPVIYVNDNFGEWHSEKSRLVEQAEPRARLIMDQLKPDESDYFIIKPQFSGFYSTNLPVLLPKLGVSKLILTGIATDICVLFTAADAHMRDYALWVPEDAVAAESDERGRWALEIMATSMSATIEPSDRMDMEVWLSSSGTAYLG